MGRVYENWLTSKDHDKAASAMMKCQHSGAFCWSDGYCHYGGDCFDTDRAALTTAKKLIFDAFDGQSTLVRHYLSQAAESLDKIRGDL